MTVPSTQSRIQYAGDGATSQFDFPFPFVNREDVKVLRRAADGTESPLTLDTTYTVTVPGGGTGGRVTTAEVLPAGATLTIYRDPEPVQETDFRENDRFFAETLESALDYLTMIAQRNRELGARSLRLRESDPATGGQFDARANRISSLASAVADSDAVTLAQLKAFTAQLGNPGSNVPPNQLQQITDAVVASAQLTGLFSPLNASVGNLTTRITAAEGQIVALSQIAGDPNNFLTLISTETANRIAGDGALASTISKLGALSGDGLAFILNVDTAKISASESLAQRLSGIAARQDSADAAVLSEASARATADSALSQSITTLQTNLSGQTTTLQVLASTVDGVQAKYTVKIDNNGYVTGYGLISSANNGVPTSQFTVLADRFAVVLPGATPQVPFVAGNINGSPGVGINGSLIVDGTIVARHLAANSISASAIQVGTITADRLVLNGITTDRIASNAITNANVSQLQNFTSLPYWGGGAFTAMPYICEVSLTTTGGNVLLIGTADVEVLSNLTTQQASAVLQLVKVSGTPNGYDVARMSVLSTTQIGHANSYNSGRMSLVWMVTGLPAGTHTFRLGAYKDFDSASLVCSTNYRSLVAQEFKR